MNVLFLTLVGINSVEDRGIYQDLLRKFRDEGHQVTIVTPVERRKKIRTNFRKENGVSILQVKTFNIQKTNLLEKGIGTLSIEFQYLSAIKKYLSTTQFDLVLYSTPPITFVRVIEYIKKRDKAYSYLLLKDIFPQNAVDMKMLKENGFLHRQFLQKEKRLYQISDTIGCMSPANVEFVLKHHSEIPSSKVEVNPNSIEPIEFQISTEEKKEIRQKYEIPLDKKVFVYGGNLGKPQGVDFLLETIEHTINEEVFFLIVGDGTEYNKIQNWFSQYHPENAKLLQKLPKLDYDKLLMACDIGLIFLDRNFLIPNFPSRLLSYLEMGKPIIAATDPNTDLGNIIENAKCGYKVLSGNQEEMQTKIMAVLENDLHSLAENGKKLLYENYTVQFSYDLIKEKLN
ncbi:MAG: glycosyltransferase family 4 protein [Bacteroidetes bacterium]|nr:glycosyltransferase family 4 protein [Bacteroidota bacterium]